MEHAGSSNSSEKRHGMHMLGHGLEATSIPENQRHFIMAAERQKEENEKDNKHKLMVGLLADVFMGNALNNANNNPQFDLIGILQNFWDFLTGNEGDDLPTRERIDQASARFGTPTYDELDGIISTGNANFDTAVEFVLEREGYLSNHSHDRGGLTKYGISQNANPDIDVANLTREDAIAIYKDRYWDAIGADNMDMSTALVAFDASVNHGAGTAQRMLNETGGKIDSMLEWRMDYYDKIVDNDSSQSVFLAGWRNRIGHLADELNEMSNNSEMTQTASVYKPSTSILSMS